MCVPPQVFSFNPISKLLSWTPVETDCEYCIEFKPSDTPDWTELCIVDIPQCAFDKSAGTYDLRGKVRKKKYPPDPFGPYGPKGVITVP